MSRPLRHFAVFRRQFSQSPFLSQQNGGMRYQRVTFVRPLRIGDRFRNFYKFMIVALAVEWAYSRSQRPARLERKAQREMKEAVEQARLAKHTGKIGSAGDVAAETGEDVEIEAEEGVEAVGEGKDEAMWDDDLVPEKQPDDALFIPLWFAQQLPTLNYGPNDPEYLMFVKCNEHPTYILEVKGRLLKTVRSAMLNAPGMQELLGNPIQTGMRWVDVQYPASPPPYYVRLGVEITDDYIAVLHRPVAERNLARLHNTLYPVATAEALLETTWLLLKLQYSKLRHGVSDEKNAVNAPSLPEARVGKKTTATAGTEKGSDGASQALDDARRITSLPLPSMPTTPDDLKRSVGTFRRLFAQKNKIPISPPQGTFTLSGSLEFLGNVNAMVVDFQAIFDPKQNKFVTIFLHPRNPTSRKLIPRPN